jgi:hypothetical protein
MRQQPFASPEEALAHYGVKGMRWGHRKKEETSERDRAKDETTGQVSPIVVAARNEAQKQAMESVLGKPVLDSGGRVNALGSEGQVKTGGFHRDGKLSKREKQALILGAGVGVGVAGFVAYKYMGGDFGVPKAWKVPEGLNKGPISKAKIGDLGHGNSSFELKDKNFHVLDTSKGYAIWRPRDNQMPGGVSSFADNPFGKKMHDEMISAVDEMRERYPAVRNMNLEVVPMSMVPGMEPMAAAKSGAAVMSIKPGEARIMYNDLMPEGYSVDEKAFVQSMMPGLKYDGFTGYHEMGHLLAAAKGDLPPAFDLMSRQDDIQGIESARELTKVASFVRDGVRFNQVKHARHKDRFKKHGLSYKELRKLSPYAATEPAEAMAELAGNYFHPKTRAQMSPETAAKAKALFDDLGGVTG